MLEAPEVEPHMHQETGQPGRKDTGYNGDLSLRRLRVHRRASWPDHQARGRGQLWPNISYGISNTNVAHTRDDITLTLKNGGVGPACIDSFELFYKGKPMSGPVALLQACCATDHMSFGISPVIDEMLGARV